MTTHAREEPLSRIKERQKGTTTHARAEQQNNILIYAYFKEIIK